MTTTPTTTTTPTSDAVDLPENIRGILARCRDFIDTTKVPAYPAGADLADEIDALLAAQGFRDGAVPQRWKAVPVNPTPEMWKAAKTVPDPNPPYPPHYGLVWDAMLAASPTPPAEQQAAQVIINFPQVGTAGPFPVVDGRVSLPDPTMQDLVRMLRPTYEAEQQAAPKAAPGN